MSNKKNNIPLIDLRELDSGIILKEDDGLELTWGFHLA